MPVVLPVRLTGREGRDGRQKTNLDVYQLGAAIETDWLSALLARHVEEPDSDLASFSPSTSL
jgi:hypothetical protein